MFRILLTAIAILAITALGIAQVTFQSTAPSKVEVNKPFQVKFTLMNASGSKFKPPQFANLTYISGPQRYSAKKNINGKRKSTLSYAYNLKAVKAGKYKLGVATIYASGRKLETKPITIEVVATNTIKTNKKSSSTKSNDEDEMPDPSNQDAMEQYVKDNVFIIAELSDTAPYVGEQVVIQYKLYTNQKVSSLNITQEPSYTGFWVEKGAQYRSFPQKKDSLNGKLYTVATLRTTSVFPQRSGELIIEPMQLEMIAQIRTQPNPAVKNGANWFRNVRTKSYKVVDETEQTSLKVLPLPEKNKPKNFTGAVGQFQTAINLSPIKTYTDEPITLSYRINGSGNLKLIEDPVIDLPESFESFDPKINATGGAKADKVYEYFIFPREPGTYNLGPFEFGYFDPVSERYIIKQSKRFKVIVEEGDDYNQDDNNNQYFGDDIRPPIDDLKRLKKPSKAFFGSAPFYVTCALPLLLLTLVLAKQARDKKLHANAHIIKKDKANLVALKRLQIANDLKNKGDRKGFYNETIRAVLQYLNDKFNLPTSEQSRQQIEATLLQKNITPETSNQLIKLIDNCDIALYAPASDGDMDKTFTNAVDFITSVENQLKQ